MTMFAVSFILFFQAISAFDTYPPWDNDFDHKSFVTVDEDFLIYWTSDLNACQMEFGLIVETEGWAAIGISQTGGMSKSDMVVGYIDINGDAVLQNYYRDDIGNGMPTLFADQSGIELIDGWKEVGDNSTLLYLRFVKDIFPSSDRQFAIDIPIGTAKVIYAWSDSQSFGYHGPTRGTEAMNLLSGDSMEVPLPEDAAYVDILQPNVEVPDDDTSYWCTLLELPVFEDVQHIVRIDPLTQPENEGIVHHHVVNICPVKYFDPDYLNQGFDCDEYANMATNASHCRSGITLYSWAVGGKNFYLPENVGIEMGGSAEDRIQYVLLETHYDNPTEEAGFVDASGLRFWYTPTLREESAVVISIFDGYDQWIPPGYIGKNYAFSPQQCTADGGVPADGVNVIASFHHQHLLGRAGKTRHIRDGVELKPIDVNEAYDFDFQQFVPSQGDIVILPGDEIILECTVDATGRTEITEGGESTRDEMCGVFLLVYPPPKLRAAGSVWDPEEKQQFISDAIDLGYYDQETNSYDINLNGSLEFYEDFVNSPTRYMYCVDSTEQAFAELMGTIPQIEQEYNMSDYVICGVQEQAEDEFDWNVWYVYLIAVVIGLCLIGCTVYIARKLCCPKKGYGLPNYQEMGAKYGATKQKQDSV